MRAYGGFVSILLLPEMICAFSRKGPTAFQQHPIFFSTITNCYISVSYGCSFKYFFFLRVIFELKNVTNLAPLGRLIALNCCNNFEIIFERKQ